MLIYLLKGLNTKHRQTLKKPNEAGIHFVRLEILNLTMKTFPGSVDLEDDT